MIHIAHKGTAENGYEISWLIPDTSQLSEEKYARTSK